MLPSASKLALLFAFSLATGARTSELSRVRYPDDIRPFLIDSEKGRNVEMLEITFPASKARTRADAVKVTVPALTYRLGAMLHDFARLYGLPPGSYPFRSAPAKESMAYPPGLGTPCTTLSKAISKLARLLGPQPKGIRFSHHSKRRSLAQWMAFRGVPEATIMQLIGWRSESVKRYYTPWVQSIIYAYGGSVEAGALHAFFPASRSQRVDANVICGHRQATNIPPPYHPYAQGTGLHAT